MADYAHELTDRELTALERRIKETYEKARDSVTERASKYLDDIKPESEKLIKAMTDATDDREYRAAKRKYQQFLRDQTVANKRFIDLQSKLAAEISKFNQQTADAIAQRMNGVFSLNHNFAAYTLEHDLGLNLQFTLYDERTVERLLRDQPKLLPKPKIDIPLDQRWNQQKISGEIAQAILSGDSIPKIADRLQNVVGMNETSAIRNARTAITSAENAGRIESYHYAESIGITLQKEWLATLDDRTRDEHRQLDGQRVGVDEPFEVDGAKIMFPGDPDAEGYLVYGCRCSLVSAVEGVKDLDPVYRRDNISGELIDDQSYKEWSDARLDQTGGLLPYDTGLVPIGASDDVIKEITERLNFGSATALVSAQGEGLSYRYYAKEDAMSDWGHAMFADDRSKNEGYGGIDGYAFSVDKSKLTDIEDLKEKMIEARIADGYEWSSVTSAASDDDFFEMFNPKDIVDNALAWDDGVAVNWFYNEIALPNGIAGINTFEGAIVFDNSVIDRNIPLEILMRGGNEGETIANIVEEVKPELPEYMKEYLDYKKDIIDRYGLDSMWGKMTGDEMEMLDKLERKAYKGY